MIPVPSWLLLGGGADGGAGVGRFSPYPAGALDQRDPRRFIGAGADPQSSPKGYLKHADLAACWRFREVSQAL